jgi:uncharacterized membrane-anchored protein
MLKKISLFLLAVLIQVTIVALVPAKQIYARMTGRLITIKTAPVDPYNIMSGYYVTLSYQISNPRQTQESMSEEDILKDVATPYNSPVYVLLKEDPNKIWIIDSVSKQPPDNVPSDRVLIQGRTLYNRIIYGVESYYIPEDKRQTIDSDLRNNREKTFAQIKVDKFGNAALVRLLIGDTVYEY